MASQIQIQIQTFLVSRVVSFSFFFLKNREVNFPPKYSIRRTTERLLMTINPDGRRRNDVHVATLTTYEFLTTARHIDFERRLLVAWGRNNQ